MRIGRRLSLMQRHSPLGRPRPLAALQVSLASFAALICWPALYGPDIL